MDFDEDRIYYSHQNLQQKQPGEDGNGGGLDNNLDDDQLDLEAGSTPDLRAVKRHCREFLRKL
jgi:hypothetical protein